MPSIADNLHRVQERIAQAAQRTGRSAEEITLVTVTKTIPVEWIRQAIAAGAKVIGENRVQEAASKFSAIDSPVTWHLIGHLQTNKVNKALQIFDLIHSVDSLRLAQKISHRALTIKRVIDILIQVNTSGESSKFGVASDQLLGLMEAVSQLPGVAVKGLMTIAPLGATPVQLRATFGALRKWGERVASEGFPTVTMSTLSMGMTSDFEVAIEEGANLVRIGTAIFGPRG